LRSYEPTYTGPYIQRYFGDSWSMHLPFAYDLMREFRPKVFVELGVWKGESYFSFCQSAADHRIPTQCYGIDTWRGDVHMGDFDPEIGIEVAEYNWRYSSFSELRTKTFAEAVDEFADGTIDLLHIDGTHTYEDVKGDFKAWLPKVSAEGIVLLHDVAVHDRGFGVWRLWEEIAKPGQSFLFEFGYGLGVWKKVPVVDSDSAWLRRLFELNHAEQKRINAYYVTAAAALALWHKSQDRKNRDEIAKPLPVQVFVDQGGSFSETSSMTAELVPGRWQSIRFDHLEKLGPKRRGRIRLDPVNCLAFVNISSIRLITDSDKRVFYSASSAADFAQINVSEGVLKHETDGILELVATDSDPQVFLPELNFPSGDSWHLEVDLEVHTAPSNIILRQKETFAELRGLEASQAEVGRLVAQSQTAELQIQALQTEQQTQAKLDREQIASLENELRSSRRAGKELQTQAKLNKEQVASLENELRSSRRAGKELQAASAQLSSQLETERAQYEEQVRNIEQQKNVAEREFEETRRALLKSRDETARVSGVLEIRNSNSAGLALYNARLQRRLEVSGGLRAVGEALKHGDSEMPAIADSILEDIERIRHPSFLWRMAKAFGILRFAQPGVPRTAADRRAIAKELKAAVRETCKALSSATTAPNDAATKITRLFELRRRRAKSCTRSTFPLF
jgi:Chromosome segregation ATPases